MVVTVGGGVHGPKLPAVPALFVGVGHPRLKSALLSCVSLVRLRLCVPSPADRVVGVPEAGVPSCVDVFRGPV